MKFDRSNKSDFCYYGQVNTFGGNIYFAGDGIFICTATICLWIAPVAMCTEQRQWSYK